MVQGPIAFHRVRGENIRVSDMGRKASRVDSFNKALCFTDRPIQPDEKLHFKIDLAVRSWSGTLRVGVTYNNPDVLQDNLPKYCCPDLNMRPGYWGKALDESAALSNTQLQLYCTLQGNVMLKVNNGPFEVFITGVRTGQPMFVVFDIYGNTQGVVLEKVTSIVEPEAALANPQTAHNNQAQQQQQAIVSKSFKNITITPAKLCPVSTKLLKASAAEATSLAAGRPFSLLATDTTICAGQAIILQLQDTHGAAGRKDQKRVRLALSTSTPAEIAAYATIDDLADATYTLPFNSGLATPGEELAVVISEQGVVHVSHAATKWLQTVHVDPVVHYRLVVDMQHVKQLAVVGATAQLQPPAGSSAAASSAADGGSGSKAAADVASGKRGDANGGGHTDCVVCLEEEREVLAEPCNHFVLCSECAETLMRGPQKQCPVCRQTIRSLKKIFMN